MDRPLSEALCVLAIQNCTVASSYFGGCMKYHFKSTYSCPKSCQCELLSFITRYKCHVYPSTRLKQVLCSTIFDQTLCLKCKYVPTALALGFATRCLPVLLHLAPISIDNLESRNSNWFNFKCSLVCRLLIRVRVRDDGREACQ